MGWKFMFIVSKSQSIHCPHQEGRWMPWAGGEAGWAVSHQAGSLGRACSFSPSLEAAGAKSRAGNPSQILPPWEG